MVNHGKLERGTSLSVRAAHRLSLLGGILRSVIGRPHASQALRDGIILHVRPLGRLVLGRNAHFFLQSQVDESTWRIGLKQNQIYLHKLQQLGAMGRRPGLAQARRHAFTDPRQEDVLDRIVRVA